MEGQRQIVRCERKEPYPNLVCVFVQIAPADSGALDRFYVCRGANFVELWLMAIKSISQNLAAFGLENLQSVQTGLLPSDIKAWEGQVGDSDEVRSASAIGIDSTMIYAPPIDARERFLIAG